MLKGFISKGKKVQAKEAPPELKEVPTPQEEFLDKKPSVVTTEVRESLRPVEEQGKPVAVRRMFQRVPKEPTAVVPKKTVLEPVKEVEPVVKPKVEKKVDVDLDKILEDDYDDAIKRLGKLILEEEKGDPYDHESPDAYVPESRRGFSEFIKMQYEDYILKPIGEQAPTPAGEKYPYQKFVREYIRQASPYRGILVYHGLGSGKTCTAIAASEALFSSSNKKIIVMTPFSLRKNFLKEITFCGFRHFRLQNYWISLDKEDPIHEMFALKILNISPGHLKTARHIWVPDFDQTEPNYNSLSPEDQTEIRKQILSVLVYDAKTNPTGRIRFINYNGITSTKLKEIACSDPTFFDDAVIVVDEIHNLARLIQGNIEPYLVETKTLKRKIPFEKITADKWNPTLCTSAYNYKRGYLFYRLLLSATNSKIIGLSGTPLINFPEELGILANILHGYIPVAEGVINTSVEEKSNIEKALLEHKFTDFVRVEPDKTGSGVRFYISLLPEGVRKVSNDIGVERIPQGIEIPTRQEIVSDINTMLEEKGYTFNIPITLRATALLPPFYEEFTKNFLNQNKTEVANKEVLLKRLTGIISYYKGSRQDLMPKVIKDVVVRIPMSEYQQKMYTLERTAEIDIEKSKKSSVGGLDAVWSEVFEIANMKSSTSYRMGSRQVCNFAFPPQVKRPRPSNIQEQELEAPDQKDIVDSSPDLLSGAPEESEQYPEIPETGDEDEKAAQAEDDAIDLQGTQQQQPLTIKELIALKKAKAREDTTKPEASMEGGDYESDMEGGDSDDEDEEDPEEARRKKIYKLAIKRLLAKRVSPTMTDEEKYAIKSEIKKELREKIMSGEVTYEELEEENKKERERKKALMMAKAAEAVEPIAPVALVQKKTVKKVLEEKKAISLSDCKAGMKEGQTYQEAIQTAKQCLVQLAYDNLRLDNPEGLSVISPKYAAILRNIQDAPGSSLVYSQFLDMEGIGIFRLVMDANGYAPIEIISSPKGYMFSERTEKSLRKGNLQPRYITFSGQEKEDVRRLALDVFNANFNELPESLSTVLLESGFENNNNKKGQICRCFCITSAGAEGLSLKNVRAVHIMEPYWNDVRLKQVKGRAIRIGSHLDLPKEDQNVSIYTYITVFGPEAQRAKTGVMKIDETVNIRDSIERKDAIEAGVPIPEGLTTYVLTSDERLFVISERKKKITEELEVVMKSSAIDCELNYAENKDGTFRCLPLKGKIGDFLYHPDLNREIIESASSFKIKKQVQERELQYVSVKGVQYAIEKKEDKYYVYDRKDLSTVIGEMHVSETGQPKLPISFY